MRTPPIPDVHSCRSYPLEVPREHTSSLSMPQVEHSTQRDPGTQGTGIVATTGVTGGQEVVEGWGTKHSLCEIQALWTFPHFSMLELQSSCQSLAPVSYLQSL